MTVSDCIEKIENLVPMCTLYNFKEFYVFFNCFFFQSFRRWPRAIVTISISISWNLHEVVTSRIKAKYMILSIFLFELAQTAAMENSDRAFESIRKNLATAGITENLRDQSYPFNGIILFGFLLLGLANACVFVFIFNDANEFADYTQAVFGISVVTVFIFALLILILRVEQLFAFIDGGNELFNISGLKIGNISPNEFSPMLLLVLIF